MALVMTGEFDPDTGEPLWSNEPDPTPDTSSTGGGSDFVTEIPNTTKPGEVGYGWKYYSDGTAISPTGQYYYQGALKFDPNKTNLTDLASQLMKGTISVGSVAKYISQNPAQAAGIIGGLANLNTQPDYNRVGYQGSIPQQTAVRKAVPITYDPNRRPGSGGQQYFTDVQYVPKSDAAGIAAAQNAATQQAEQLAMQNAANPAKQTLPPTKAAAHGGLMKLAAGSYIGGIDKRSLYEMINDMVNRNKGSSAMPDMSYQSGSSQASSDPVQALMAMLGNQTAQTPRPVDAPETTQGTTPAQMQDTTPQGTTPALIPPEKLKLEEPVAIPEQLSQEAYHLLHPGADAPEDRMNWYEDKNNTYGLGGGGPLAPINLWELKEPLRVFKGYQNIPLEALNKYAKARSDFYKENNINEYVPVNLGDIPKILEPYSVWEEYKPLEKPEEPVALPEPQKAAHGGLMALARGRYLQGTTDGMADKLPASIDNRQPAKLSHGEFVVPADVVSHLGNGNSDAGAKKLYSMMDKIRMARTGTKKQGKQINPDKFMPGGSVGYASGGGVKGYPDGGIVDTTKTSTPYESNLSTWAGPYVTGVLGKGMALGEMPYQAYQGPLTAGASTLQESAFKTAGDLKTPEALTKAATTAGDVANQMKGLSYTPGTFGNQYSAPTTYQTGTFTTDTFGSKEAQQYMNPYLQAALDPQIAEARRQAQITNLQNLSKLTQAGAYGGGRQAIMQSEADRNLASNLANITGQGYNTAYQQAAAQFNADQQRKQAAQAAAEQSRQFGYGQQATAAQLAAQYGLSGQQAAEQAKQFGANYGLQALQNALQAAQAQGALGTQQGQMGLQNLAQQAALGQQQRGITAEGIAADKAQFEEARDYPYKMVQFQQSLLSGLPLQTQAPVTTQTPGLTNFAQTYSTLQALLDKLGIKDTKTA